MEELIGRVAAAAGIPVEQAARTVNVVFAFLKQEAPAQFEELTQHMPEAKAAGAAGDDEKAKTGGSLISGLMGKMGGGLMALAAQLTGIGLGTGEMTAAGKEIFAFAREKAGDEKVDEVVSAIPGLSQLV